MDNTVTEAPHSISLAQSGASPDVPGDQTPSFLDQGATTMTHAPTESNHADIAAPSHQRAETHAPSPQEMQEFARLAEAAEKNPAGPEAQAFHAAGLLDSHDEGAPSATMPLSNDPPKVYREVPKKMIWNWDKEDVDNFLAELHLDKLGSLVKNIIAIPGKMLKAFGNWFTDAKPPPPVSAAA